MLAFAALLTADASAALARDAAGSWEGTIAAFEARDRADPPPTGATLFVGSSSIVSWSSLERDMAPLKVLNRGFGGSELVDVYRYADRIVVPYRPRAIVMYAGDNDLSGENAKGAEAVLDDFRRFVARVRERLPRVYIYYLSTKPSPLRWDHWIEMQRSNAKIRSYATHIRRVRYVDVATPMLDDLREPQRELYAEDGLHLSAEGYALWTRILRPILLRDLERSQAKPVSND